MLSKTAYETEKGWSDDSGVTDASLITLAIPRTVTGTGNTRTIGTWNWIGRFIGKLEWCMRPRCEV